MSACVIGHIRIKDAEKWAQYRAQVPATLAPWGAELLFRGSVTAILSGEHAATDTVIIRFPDPASVNDWYCSTAYQTLIPLRQQAAEVTLICCTD